LIQLCVRCVNQTQGKSIGRINKPDRGVSMAQDAMNDHTMSRRAMKAELLDAETELRWPMPGATSATKRRCTG
jgi:hypothetical protein